MSFDAGSVFATLGFKVNPGGLAKYEAMMSKASSSASKSEAASAKAAAAAERSSAAMAAAGAKAAASVERLAIANQRAALQVVEAQRAMALATEKYGAESTRAQKASLAHQEALRKQRVVSADLAAAQASLTASQGRQTVATSKGSAALTTLGSAAKTGAAAGLIAMGAAAIYSVRKSMDLQKALAEVQAVTKANTTQMAAYKAKAIEVGTATGVGATKAAGALAELAKGGLSVKDTLTALDGTIALAQSSGMDFADSATTVVKALSTFNLKGNQATMVADGLASAAAKTSMDVSDFAQAFAQGGAAAAAAGLNFDETVNVMGAMANKFQSGSDMGTSLKTTLTQLAHPTKRAQTAMKDLGIDVWQASGKIKPAAEMVKILGEKFAGMTNKQKLATAATIAGTDGMRTLLALSSSTGGKIREVGSAQQMAADKTDNLEGNLDKLKAQFDALAISAGDTLVPALTDATKQATKFMQEMRTGKGTGGDFKTTVDDITGALKTVADSPVMGIIWDQFKRRVDGSGQAIGGIAKAVDGIFSLDPGKFFDGLVQAAGGAAKQILAPFNALKDGIKDALGAGEAKPKVKQTTTQNIQTKVTMQTADLGGDLTRIAGLKIPPKVLRVIASTADAETKVRALQGMKLPDKYQKILGQDIDARVKLAAVAAMAKGATAARVLKITSSLGDVGSKLDALRGAAADATRTRQLKIATNAGNAVAALKAIDGTRLGGKTVAILAKDGPAKAKIQALINLGIPPKTAQMLGNNSDALKKAAALNSTTLRTLSQNMVRILANPGFTGPPPPPVKQSVIRAARFATGRGADGAETALVGEGAGREHVGNPDKGWRTVTGPTWMNLAADDYVIPTESRYAGNAIGFLQQMYGAEAARVAHEMGVSGYKKGKKAKKARYIPSHVYAKHSTEYYDGVVQNLTSAAAERTSKGKLTPAAKRAKAALGKAKKERDAAHKYADQIATATGEADIFADQMQQADLKDDQGAYNTAFAGRKKQIQKAIDLLKVAVKLGPKGGAWAQSMRKQLSSLGVDVLAKPEDVVDKAADPTTYSDAEQKILDKLNSDEALAALTETTTDDIAAETAKRDWLQGILADAIRNPAARGGASAITAIAGELKSTTDSLANLTKAPDVSADLQAQIDQGKERERIANANAAVNAGGLAAFTGAGDIGAGGPNAYRAAGGVTVNFQSTLAPSPAEARRAADLVVGGIGYQGAPPSPRQVV